jgi:gliding motility-associated-like protein
MNKRLIPHLFFLFICLPIFSQGIQVDTTSYTIPQLVRNVLMQSSCSNETNFLFSSKRAIGRFTNTNPSFPIQEGIVIRNGIAKYTEGPYTGLNESTQINTNGDTDLQTISNNNGQSATIRDVAFLQFDFTPLSSNFSFDFLFASNEYGQYQCGFSDVFAFILTDLTTGLSTNLAVIPGTSTPITVKNIRNAAYNSSCLSAYPSLFARYNVINPTTAAINMRGETVLLTASSPVIPNRTYRIKLAIGDYLDTTYDSAVFIAGGSFVTNTDLGPDRAICMGESTTLDSGLGSQFTYSWTRNNVLIPGENNATLTINQPGTYVVTASIPSTGCVITDEIIISTLQTNTPYNITVCDTGQPSYLYNLTQNNITTLGLDPNEYSIMYFDSLANAMANGPEIPSADLIAYTSSGNQTIYIKIIHTNNNNTICDDIFSFELLVNSSVNATTPPDLNFCDSSSGTVMVDLTVQDSFVLNGQNPANYTLTYYTSLSDAQNSSNAITPANSHSITLSQSPQTIWVKMQDNANAACSDIVSFVLHVHPLPLVDVLTDVIECSEYVLPPLTNGTYFSGPNGTGIMMSPGDIITDSGTIYIFNGPIAPNGCTNESSFTVTLIVDLNFSTTACGQYIVQDAPEGDFFTGPSGTGTLITPGTVLLTDQTIYFYSVIDGVVCRDESFDIKIIPLPVVDQPSDVVTCNSYTLEPLTNGNYFTGSNGTGTPLFAGDIITSSQDIYVYTDNGTCANESTFRVDIIDTSIYQPLSACGSYTLPPITIGNYYDQPFGGGNVIPAGTVISSSQSVFYYIVTTSTPNCTDNLNYQITINPLPIIDTPSNILVCDNYSLPTLTNGSYYTETNGGGTALSPGTIITTTQTLYVYAIDANMCSNEHSFTITIRPLPPVDSLTDIFTCTNHTLQPLTNGTYYSAPGGPNGSGNIIPVGTVITTTQTIFIYNQWNDFTTCTNETLFNVEVINVDVGNFSDIEACDSYTLPSLTTGNYYSQPNGQGPTIPAGTIITNSQTIYVYHIVGVRLTCSDEKSFAVNITITPSLPNFSNVEACGSYTLPPLVNGNYFSGPNGTGTAYAAGQSITSSRNMYVFLAAATNSNCKVERLFSITIHPLNTLTIQPGSICVNNQTGALINSAYLSTGLNPAVYTVEWYLNNVLVGTGVNYTAIVEGTYTVVPIKNTPDIGSNCGYNNTTVVVGKSSSAIANAIVTDAFDDNIDIVVNVTGGFGEYLFQLNNGLFQSSNVFQNVDSGQHIITIKDTKGNCGDITLIVNVVRYPKFFTPNNDGHNETWNIWNLSHQPESRIYIFDRYGKFLKQLSPAGNGWDGTFNGKPLPSTDYWFQVFYKLNDVDQVFKAHFSLKR